MILTLESTSATHPNKNKMKKTYMTPSITMMDLDKETPIICASMGSNTPPLTIQRQRRTATSTFSPLAAMVGTLPTGKLPTKKKTSKSKQGIPFP